MDMKQLEELGLSDVLESSNDPGKLGFKLQQILGTRDAFACTGIVSGAPGSTRIFYANPAEDAPPFDRGLGSPMQIARNLMAGTDENQMRYPEKPNNKHKKGWVLRSVVIDGRAAAVAETAWV